MANDRLILVCRACGKQKTLAKYYPASSLQLTETGPLNAWMAEHLHEASGGMWLPDVPFELITEQEGG